MPNYYLFHLKIQKGYKANLNNIEELQHHALRGNLYENLVITEILKSCFNQGLNNNLLYYRDRRHEVDLLFKATDKFKACEIKSASTFDTSFSKSLHYIDELLEGQIAEKYVIHPCTKPAPELGIPSVIMFRL